MTSIPDASSAKRYEVSVGPGEYADPFLIKPWTAVIGVDSGSNGVTPNGFMLTEILAPVNTLGFDPSWGASGFSVGWFSNLGFQNAQTFGQVPGSQPQLNFNSCAFTSTWTFLGPATTGTDNLVLADCLLFDGITVHGWQFLWTRHCEFLDGLVDLGSVAGALSDTTWLAQNTSVGVPTHPTNITLGSAGAQKAIVDFSNVGVVGIVTLNGPNTLYRSTPEGVPPAVNFVGGAPPINVQGGLGYAAANLADWSGMNPISVANALDRIAAQVGPIL
jgi:hypothetical protein